MKGYFIRPSRITPSVYFNPKNQLLDVRGKSSPENALAFYNVLLQNIDSYVQLDVAKLTVNMAFEYFNTSSSKCLFMILKKLESVEQLGKKVVVNWYYECDDEDMKEAGEDFSSFFEYEFNFKEVPVINTLGGIVDKEEKAA
ncbi:DUF1987 domain-containing protein [Reichenbachiella agarivorans]|uniref:DUF1987 domain-containing protein n=1 Tax=Reichenbachiella agarivorans TaxID=2979464 RepID=A0ABY6CR53_9BACT|nr:DUF1987 domain-containing protein [Reichenbachiella agarivorans]UXP32973.1 DUF1987 domain-containing protein [Reichenbachiella agarivorans]